MKKGSVLLRVSAFLCLVSFLAVLIINDMFMVKESIAAQLGLPEPTKMLNLSQKTGEVVLRGLKVNPENPFQINFILDKTADSSFTKEQSRELVDYFLAALTVPNEDFWVNLSPYEKDRIITDELGKTSFGKEMLSQDYVLKQLSSSLTHPDSEIGQEYWKSLNANNGQGQAMSLQESFNKIWIVPNEINLYEKDQMVFIKDASLELKTEKDYLAMDIVGEDLASSQNTVDSKESIKSLLLPKIENDINNGKNFTKLRQIYSSLILAAWFKKKMYNAYYAAYINQNKTKNIELSDKEVKTKVFNLYKESFEKGVYKLKKKVTENNKKQYRSYFSGGLDLKNGIDNANYSNETPNVAGSTMTNVLVDLKVSSSSLSLDEFVDFAYVRLMTFDRDLEGDKKFFDELFNYGQEFSVDEREQFVEKMFTAYSYVNANKFKLKVLELFNHPFLKDSQKAKEFLSDVRTQMINLNLNFVTTEFKFYILQALAQCGTKDDIAKFDSILAMVSGDPSTADKRHLIALDFFAAIGGREAEKRIGKLTRSKSDLVMLFSLTKLMIFGTEGAIAELITTYSRVKDNEEIIKPYLLDKDKALVLGLIDKYSLSLDDVKPYVKERLAGLRSAVSSSSLAAFDEKLTAMLTDDEKLAWRASNPKVLAKKIKLAAGIGTKDAVDYIGNKLELYTPWLTNSPDDFFISNIARRELLRIGSKEAIEVLVENIMKYGENVSVAQESGDRKQIFDIFTTLDASIIVPILSSYLSSDNPQYAEFAATILTMGEDQFTDELKSNLGDEYKKELAKHSAHVADSDVSSSAVTLDSLAQDIENIFLNSKARIDIDQGLFENLWSGLKVADKASKEKFVNDMISLYQKVEVLEDSFEILSILNNSKLKKLDITKEFFADVSKQKGWNDVPAMLVAYLGMDMYTKRRAVEIASMMFYSAFGGEEAEQYFWEKIRYADEDIADTALLKLMNFDTDSALSVVIKIYLTEEDKQEQIEKYLKTKKKKRVLKLINKLWNPQEPIDPLLLERINLSDLSNRIYDLRKAVSSSSLELNGTINSIVFRLKDVDSDIYADAKFFDELLFARNDFSDTDKERIVTRLLGVYGRAKQDEIKYKILEFFNNQFFNESLKLKEFFAQLREETLAIDLRYASLDAKVIETLSYVGTKDDVEYVKRIIESNRGDYLNINKVRMAALKFYAAVGGEDAEQFIGALTRYEKEYIMESALAKLMNMKTDGAVMELVKTYANVDSNEAMIRSYLIEQDKQQVINAIDAYDNQLQGKHLKLSTRLKELRTVVSSSSLKAKDPVGGIDFNSVFSYDLDGEVIEFSEAAVSSALGIDAASFTGFTFVISQYDDIENPQSIFTV